MNAIACLAVVRTCLARAPELAPVVEFLERMEIRDSLNAARQSRYRERKKTSGAGHPEAGPMRAASQPRAEEAGAVASPIPPPPPPEQVGLPLPPIPPRRLHGKKKPAASDPTPPELAIVELVLGKLSANSGRSYIARMPNGKYTQHCRMIVRLLREGYTEHDLRIVVWERSVRWAKDPTMSEWLRPKTLFGPENFVDYLPHATSSWSLKEDEKARTGREPTGAALRVLLEVAEQEGKEYGDGYEEDEG